MQVTEEFIAGGSILILDIRQAGKCHEELLGALDHMFMVIRQTLQHSHGFMMCFCNIGV